VELTLLTGERGVGKTSLCLKIVESASRSGWSVAGLLSPGRFVDGVKTGFDVVNLGSSERRELAQRNPNPDGNGVLQMWIFDEDVLAWGNQKLKDAPACDLLVVDELGPLELTLGRGWTAGLDLIGGGQYRQAVVVIRPELLAQARSLWPQAQTREIHGDSDRDVILGEFERKFTGTLKSQTFPG
jgi:nucleoside-triphosphatase THEP1